jgi:xanthocillin biosynthesis cytochrome P450 monooxygenase
MNSLPYFTSAIYEVLRLYAPVASMINHLVSQSGFLGGKIFIQPGPYIGWNSYVVLTNSQFWGPDAHTFKPERWGSTIAEIQTNVRRQTTKGNYIPFSMHSRNCLGQGLALSEIKIALYELAKRIKWTVDPTYQLKMSGVS